MKQNAEYRNYIENCMGYYSYAMTAISLIDEFLENNDIHELYQYEEGCYEINDEEYDSSLEAKLDEYRALLGSAGWVMSYIMCEAETIFKYLKSMPKHCLNLPCFKEMIAVCAMLCYAYLEIYDGYPDVVNYWDVESADYGFRSIPQVLRNMLKTANIKVDLGELCYKYCNW